MRLIHVMASRVRSLVRRTQQDRDLADELESHTIIAADEYVRRGMTAEEARRLALVDSGGIEAAKEVIRSQRAIPFVDTLWRDVLFAVRSFRRTPGLAATVILTLALSIGATTAMFSVVNGLLLSPLPFANGERLVWTVNRGTRPYDAMSPADLTDWARMNGVFEQVGSWLESSTNLTDGANATHISAAEVTGNWFTMLGAPMALGRGLRSDDEGLDKPRVLVLSYALWQAQFGGDARVIDRTVRLDGTPYTVVGVAQPAFAFPASVDVWRPVLPQANWSAMRASRIFHGPVALLKAGVTLEQARAQARLTAAQLRASYPSAEQGLDYDLQPLREHLVGDSRRIVFALFGAVALLLTISCVNLASLMLVRASTRQGEIGVRLALGASSRRIVGQLVVESLLLSIVGAGMGLVLARVAIQAVVKLQGSKLPLAANVRLDWAVLLFVGSITLCASLMFGLWPAVTSARTNIGDALRSGGRAAGASRAALRTRQVLVGLQIVMVVPLMVGAVLLTRSFSRLVSVDPGFSAKGVVRFDIALPRCGGVWSPDTTCVGVVGSRYMTKRSIQQFSAELTERLQSMPGTTGVAIGFGAPFTPWARNQGAIVIEGEPETPDRPNVVESKYVSPEYFATLEVPIMKGRSFSAADRLEGQPVVIVSANAVSAYFGGADPIGKRLRGMGEVVGVVGDTKTGALAGSPEPAVYAPFDQWLLPYMTVLIRTTDDPDAVAANARKLVAVIDPGVSIFHLGRMQDGLDASTAPARLAASVVMAFAAAALLLAMIGIHGVVAYVVRERRREIAIRLALGAESTRVVRLVMNEVLTVIGVGLVLGVGAALLFVRSLGGLLYDLPPTDPMTFILSIATLFVVAGLAALLPGLRAVRISPLLAMRQE